MKVLTDKTKFLNNYILKLTKKMLILEVIINYLKFKI